LHSIGSTSAFAALYHPRVNHMIIISAWYPAASSKLSGKKSHDIWKMETLKRVQILSGRTAPPSLSHG